jgi:uncharacterized surface protein with fasciclin (FAS1) repeats
VVAYTVFAAAPPPVSYLVGVVTMSRNVKVMSLVFASGLATLIASSAFFGGDDQRANAAQPPTTTTRKDIVDTAVGAGQFKTLVTAVQAAGLVDVLKGNGPFTVFAPTDEAFAKVPKETLDALLKDKAALGDVLKYHVLPGKVMAADVMKVADAKTVQGKSAKFALKINDATVIKTDIECTNGVIHVIDSVLLPPKQ